MPNEAWKNRVQEYEPRSYRDFEDVSGESTEFDWNIFQDSQRCNSVIESAIFRALWDKHQQLSQEEFIYVNVQWHFLWQIRQQRWMLKECRICGRLQKDLELVNGLSLDQVLRKKKVSFRKQSTKRLGPCCGRHVTEIRRKWTSEENWKVKEKGKCPYTSLLIKIQLIQFIALSFLSINSVSTEQWQLYAMIWRPPRQHGGTWDSDGSINRSWRSQSRNSFAKRKSHERPNYLAAVHSTSWIAFTRKQSEQFL